VTISNQIQAYARTMGVDLSTALFPYGYTSSVRTLDYIDGRNQIRLLNPEYREREYAAMIFCYAHGVPFGFGGAARAFEQQLAEALRRHTTSGDQGNGSRTYNGVRYWLRDGFASYAFPGGSNHEEGATPEGAIAGDMVPPSSLAFANEHADRFMLRHFTNVNREPWHRQPSEWPNSRRDVNRIVRSGGRLQALELPGVAPAAPVPGPDWSAVDPTPKTDEENPEMIELNAQVSVVKEGSRGTDAGRVQALLNALSGSDLDTDGYFGPVSTRQLRNVQAFIGAKVDGICGPVMWSVLIDG